MTASLRGRTIAVGHEVSQYTGNTRAQKVWYILSHSVRISQDVSRRVVVGETVSDACRKGSLMPFESAAASSFPWYMCARRV